MRDRSRLSAAATRLPRGQWIPRSATGMCVPLSVSTRCVSLVGFRAPSAVRWPDLTDAWADCRGCVVIWVLAGGSSIC